jgi:deazaflavin-dependent oxidoreductase (nitroreductase family)
MPNKLANAFIAAILRSPLHPLLGDSFAVIAVTGWKTGRRISTPINVSRMGEDLIVVSYRERTWWRNLRGNRAGELRLGGKTIPVKAEIIEQPKDVKDGLRACFERYPAYAKYFEIRMDPQGRIADADLEKAVRERLIIRLIAAPQA